MSQTSFPLRGGAMGLMAFVSALAAQSQTAPNIVFILADDLGYGDLGCYGQQLIRTPHIDSLSKAGMRFTDFYAGCSVSAPSRASLMTGLHTGHSYIRGNKEIRPEGQAAMAEQETLATLLKERGYRTGIFGKWGLGYPGSGAEPQDRGFDRFFGYNCQRQSHSYFPDHLWSNRDRVELPNNPTELHTYAPDPIQQEGLKFIREAVEEKAPFFAYFTYTLPHAELRLPEDSVYRYYAERLVPKAWKPAGVSSYAASPNAHAAFAAMVDRLDRYVGEVTALLREMGVADNTLIIFTSDNGAHTEGGADPDYFKSSGPLRGTKRALHEGGIRVPMIATWAGRIPAGTTSDTPAAFWDFLPTFAELTGKPQRRDGLSILPTLLGKKNHAVKPDRTLYWEFHEGGGRMAIRKGRYKLIAQKVDTGEPVYELYDLSTDLGETRNLAETHPKILRQLQREMWKQRTPSEVFPFKFEVR